MKAYLQVPDLLLPVGVPPGVAAVPRHPLLRLAAGQRAPGHRHLRPPQPRHRRGRPRGRRPRQDSPRLTLQVQCFTIIQQRRFPLEAASIGAFSEYNIVKTTANLQEKTPLVRLNKHVNMTP